MNVLILTQVLPYPLDAGPKVRAYYMLRHLAARHWVTLVSFVRPDDRPEYVEHLRQVAQAVHTAPIHRSAARNLWAGVKGVITGLPVAIVRDEMAEMTALLRRLAAETRFDVVHADQLSMAGWALLAAHAAARSSLSTPRTLLDEHNAIYKLTERIAAESTGLRRLIARREARAFRRYEADMLRRFDAILTVTDQDRDLLLDLLPEPECSHQAAKFTTIPICIDPTQVAPVNHPPTYQSTNPPAYQSTNLPTYQSTDLPAPTILHLGTMFWPPNVAGVLWFGRAVLPLIWQELPEARFVVVGKNPPAEVQALAADPRIEVTGYVADPRPYLEAADAFIVPLFSGGGMRVKIVDAWLWGLPVVSTTIGAEGIELQDGENILIAADAPSFAAATVRVLTDPALNRRLRLAGRRWVEARYDWRTVYRRVDAAYARLTDATQR